MAFLVVACYAMPYCMEVWPASISWRTVKLCFFVFYFVFCLAIHLCFLQASISCMAEGCSATFPNSECVVWYWSSSPLDPALSSPSGQLQKALPADLLQHYEEVVQDEVLRMSGLGDVVKCSVCGATAVMGPEEGKVLCCPKPSCRKVSAGSCDCCLAEERLGLKVLSLLGYEIACTQMTFYQAWMQNIWPTIIWYNRVFKKFTNLNSYKIKLTKECLRLNIILLNLCNRRIWTWTLSCESVCTVPRWMTYTSLATSLTVFMLFHFLEGNVSLLWLWLGGTFWDTLQRDGVSKNYQVPDSSVSELNIVTNLLFDWRTSATVVSVRRPRFKCTPLAFKRMFAKYIYLVAVCSTLFSSPCTSIVAQQTIYFT